jgi:hypothetical protein
MASQGKPLKKYPIIRKITTLSTVIKANLHNFAAFLSLPQWIFSFYGSLLVFKGS